MFGNGYLSSITHSLSFLKPMAILHFSLPEWCNFLSTIHTGLLHGKVDGLVPTFSSFVFVLIFYEFPEILRLCEKEESYVRLIL